jgi:hypothetical protein
MNSFHPVIYWNDHAYGIIYPMDQKVSNGNIRLNQVLQGHVILANQYHKCRTEVLTAVVMRSYILWDIMPCSPFKVN